MKIVSWNVNGLRSLKKDLGTIFEELDADIVCFQETKLSKEQLTESLALVDGYVSFFSFCQTKRTGYSGAATFCKSSMQPIEAYDSLNACTEESLLDDEADSCRSLSQEEITELDGEGRAVVTKHKLSSPVMGKSLLSVINVYCPCVTGEIEGRELFRLQYLQLIEEKVKILSETSHVILLGDLNISHKKIDHCDPDEIEDFDDQPHRQWFGQITDSDHGLLVDSFRYFHPEAVGAYTCWNTKTGARQTNYGTRIDYVLLNRNITPELMSAGILADYEGSDHCPVTMVTKLDLVPSEALPQLCSKNFSQFRTKQKKLTMFISTSAKKTDAFDSLKKRKSDNKQQSLLNFMKKPKIAKGESDDIISIAKQSSTDNSASSRSSSQSSVKSSNSMSDSWGSIFKKKPAATLPKCSGHGEECMKQTVKKDGVNKGRSFYACRRPMGHKDNKEARCGHFEWEKKL